MTLARPLGQRARCMALGMHVSPGAPAGDASPVSHRLARHKQPLPPSGTRATANAMRSHGRPLQAPPYVCRHCTAVL